MVTLNSATDYVHTYITNYEPLYETLVDVCARYQDSQGPLAVFRDELREAVERNYAAAGLDLEDIEDSDVDYGAMIEYELGL